MLVHPDRPELRLLGAQDILGQPAVARVDQGMSDRLAPARAVHAWARSFLAAPHRELGRTGDVCPFTGQALDADTFWVAVEDEAPATADGLAERVTPYFEWLPDLEPRSGAGAETRAVLVLFPSLGPGLETLIDDAGASLRPRWFERGYVVGRYRPASEHGSVRNDAFHPLRSPVPMLGLRPMVADDVPLLIGDPVAFTAWFGRFAGATPERYVALVAERAHALGLSA